MVTNKLLIVADVPVPEATTLNPITTVFSCPSNMVNGVVIPLAEVLSCVTANVIELKLLLVVKTTIKETKSAILSNRVFTVLN